MNQVISEIESVVGKAAIIEQHPFPETDMIATWANISRARELLDWEPATSLKEGIIATVDWYMENRDFAKNIRL
jgi:nucleoside-diphosphate-sugar epimerase